MSLTRRGFMGVLAGALAACKLAPKLGPALAEAAPAAKAASIWEVTDHVDLGVQPYSIPAYINEHNDELTWTDSEIVGEYRKLYMEKQRRAWDDIQRRLDQQLWAVPDSRKMLA